MPKLEAGSGLAGKIVYTAGIETVREYRAGTKYTKKKTDIKLVVAPFIPTLVPVEIVGQNLGDLVISVTLEKSRSQPGGSFTVILAGDDRQGTENIHGHEGLWRKLGPSMRDIFKIRTIGKLYIDGYMLMTGMLRSFRRSKVKSGDGYIQTYTAIFAELGTIYEENIIKHNTIRFGKDMNIFTSPDTLYSAASSQWLPVGGVAKAIQSYALAFLSSTVDLSGMRTGPAPGFPYYRMSDGIPLIFRMITQSYPLGGISNNTYLSFFGVGTSLFKQMGGSSFWSFLKSIATEPFFELFTETAGRTCAIERGLAPGFTTAEYIAQASTLSTRWAGQVPIPSIGTSIFLPGFCYLILRSSPYGSPMIGSVHPGRWDLFMEGLGMFDLMMAGDFVIITDDDIMEKDLGQADYQQHTLFQANLSGKSALGGAFPMSRPSASAGPVLPIYPGGVKTFGIKLLEKQMNALNSSFAGFALDNLDKAQRRLAANKYSHLLNYWFRNASKFMEGTVRVAGKPYARPGMLCIYLPSQSGTKVDDARECPAVYYIDNVSYSADAGGDDSMQMTLIRGTPIPMDASKVALHFLDWELLSPNPNITQWY